jgi:hypothetical protein
MNEKLIMEINNKKNYNRKIGSGRKPILNHDIENKIFMWFLDVRSEGIPITDELIKNRGIFLKEESKDHMNCEFSNGWLNGFKKRFHIRQIKSGSKCIKKMIIMNQ